VRREANLPGWQIAPPYAPTLLRETIGLDRLVSVPRALLCSDNSEVIDPKTVDHRLPKNWYEHDHRGQSWIRLTNPSLLHMSFNEANNRVSAGSFGEHAKLSRSGSNPSPSATLWRKVRDPYSQVFGCYRGLFTRLGLCDRFHAAACPTKRCPRVAQDQRRQPSSGSTCPLPLEALMEPP